MIAGFIKFLSTFGPNSIKELSNLYSPIIEYEDPSNKAQGLHHLSLVFEDLFSLITFLDLSNSQTQLGSIIFFYSRLIHYLCYLFAVPWLRTGFFLLSWIGLIMLSIQIITFIY